MVLPKFLRALWGDLSAEEIKRFGLLAATFFLIIGPYWMLRVMKDGALDQFVGYEYQPKAKFLSLIIVACAVLFYGKLVDWFAKHSLFYIICSFYGLGFVVLAYLFAHPDIVTAAPGSLLGSAFSWIPGKAIGWFTYLFIESFGSLVPPMFWSFMASTTTADSAKRGFAMIVSVGQIGNIFGPLAVAKYPQEMPLLFAIGGALVLLVPVMIKLYTIYIPYQKTGADDKKQKTSVVEGLRLLFTRPYLLGVAVVSIAYEVVTTIVDYQMGISIKAAAAGSGSSVALNWFKAWQGVSIGVLALTFALLGTSFLMRRFGLKFCLIAFPSIIGFVLVTIFGFDQINANPYYLTWALFIAVVIFKGMSYALNNPTKEVMYIPTSKDAKYKAKSWVDGFGNRTAKGAGAVVTNSIGPVLPPLMLYGTIASLGVVGLWILVAAFVGNTFNKLQDEKKIVE